MLKFAMLGGAIALLLLTPSASTDTPKGQRRPIPLLTLGCGTEPVECVRYSPDGMLLATGSCGPNQQMATWDNILLWDATTGKKLRAPKGSDRQLLGDLIFSPDSKRLVAASFTTALKVWDTATGRSLLSLSASEAGLSHVVLSPGGQYLASVDALRTNTLRVRDARTGAQGAALQDRVVLSFAYTADGRRLASVEPDGKVTIWEMASKLPSLTLGGKAGGFGQVTAMAFSHDSQKLALVTGNRRGVVRVWAIPSGKQCHTLNGHNGEIARVAFSPNGIWLASAVVREANKGPGGSEGEVVVWDAKTGKQKTILRSDGRMNGVFDLTFSPDGTRLATAHGDGTVRVWATKDLVGR